MIKTESEMDKGIDFNNGISCLASRMVRVEAETDLKVDSGR